MKNKNESKIFGDYSDVKSCNDCEHYHNSTCDGFSEEHIHPCSSLKLVRGTEIPKRVKKLEKRVNLLAWATLLLTLSVIIHYVKMLM